MATISDLNDIDTCIQVLRDAIRKIDATVRGTSDPNHEWVKDAKRIVVRAEVAYHRLDH
jgi:hypothetical protein